MILVVVFSVKSSSYWRYRNLNKIAMTSQLMNNNANKNEKVISVKYGNCKKFLEDL